MRSLPFLLALIVTGAQLRAGNDAPSVSGTAIAAKTPPPPDLAAVKVGPNGQPVPNFLARHTQLVERAKKGHIDLYFLGDSITQHWEDHPDLWQAAFGAWNPGNFGISGDRTEHVLWRLENGELEGVEPKVVVLMIGTNNAAMDSPEAIARGITKIVSVLRQQLPETKILLLAIFPRGKDASDPRRQANEKVNAIIGKLADDQHVFFLDIGPRFLQADGTLSRDIMPDLLHPNAAGYKIWIDAMQPKLAELMK